MKKTFFTLVFLFTMLISIPVLAAGVNKNTSFNSAIDIKSGVQYSLNGLGKIEYTGTKNNTVVDREYQDYFYKVKIAEDSYFSMDFSDVNIVFKHAGGKSWGGIYVNIYDVNKELVVSGSRLGNGSIFEGSLKAGTYYLDICPHLSCTASGSVSFDFKFNAEASSDWEMEDNNSVDKANIILVNKTYCGTIRNKKDSLGNISSDKDWYQFTAPASGFMTLVFGRKYTDVENMAIGSWDVKVYDADVYSGSSISGKKLGSLTFAEDRVKELTTSKIFIEKGHTIRININPISYCEDPYYFSAQFERSVKDITLTSVSSSDEKQIDLTWKKNGSVKGYEVQYSTDSKFKANKTESVKVGGSLENCTIKNLKSDQTYYVRVRAYKNVKYTVGKDKEQSTLCYSNWTKSKKIKVK